MEKKSAKLPRRDFISNTLKIAVLASILPGEACKNKSSKVPPGGKDNTGKISSGIRGKHKRQKWSHEGLVINTKTKVMHLPTSKFHHYYDEIRSSHMQEVSVAVWASQVQGPVHLNKDQSGKILEMLALQHFKNGVNEQSLNAATETLARAWGPMGNDKNGSNLNMTNFRLHELMIQLLTLNTSVPNKWQAFNDTVIKPSFLRKRQKWMETEAAFNERVNYITTRQTEYMNRLAERARKYSFT